jgi:YggT family protein
MQALCFVVDTVFFVLVACCLLRAWMNAQRMNMRDQPGLFALAVTDWLVGPVRKILPRALVQGAWDWGSLMAAVLLCMAYGGVWMIGASITGAAAAYGNVTIVLGIVVQALSFLLRTALQGLTVLLLAYAVLSWVQPDSPIQAKLDRLCAPFLRPLRRAIPPVGGVDLSVLVLIVLLQVGLLALP